LLSKTCHTFPSECLRRKPSTKGDLRLALTVLVGRACQPTSMCMRLWCLRALCRLHGSWTKRSSGAVPDSTTYRAEISFAHVAKSRATLVRSQKYHPLAFQSLDHRPAGRAGGAKPASLDCVHGAGADARLASQPRLAPVQEEPSATQQSTTKRSIVPQRPVLPLIGRA
jgi:hypothetical protein